MSWMLRRVAILLFLCATAAAPTPASAQESTLVPDDPIAFIGHGMLIARDGKIIRPDVDFIEKAQEVYVKSLRSRLSEADQKAFDDQRTALFRDNAIDRRNRLLANSRIIEWLLTRVGDLPDGSISGKNSLLGQLALYDNLALRDRKLTPMPDLQKRLGDAGFSRIALFSTTNFGAAYVAECQVNGVPTPPDVGSNQWTLSTLGGNENQHMAHQARTGLLARSFAEQPRIGVSGRGVRVVLAALAVKVALAVAPGADGSPEPSRRRKLFGLAHASSSVPSTEKCSLDSNPLSLSCDSRRVFA